MVEPDTIRLLRECDAGVKMGVESINDVIDYTGNQKMRDSLVECKNIHIGLQKEIDSELLRYGDDGKKPNPIASGMSKVKTEAMLIFNESDNTIADLMTDGCNMGVKSLYRYLNQYQAADERSKDIAKRLIGVEERLRTDMHEFL